MLFYIRILKMKVRKATPATLKYYAKKYAPELVRDYRKNEYRNLTPQYIEQLKKDDLNKINQILKDNYETKKKQQKITRNTNKINKYFNDKKDEILRLRNGGHAEFIFNTYDINLDKDFRKEFLKEFLNKIRDTANFTNNAVIHMEIGGLYYGLGGAGMEKLINAFKGQYGEYSEDSGIATREIMNKINNGENLYIKSVNKSTKTRRQVGAFFKYYNITNLNLERYQITDGKNNFKDDNMNNDNCLIYALKILGIEEDKISIIKNYVVVSGCHYVPMSKLNELCETIKIRIELYTNRKTKTENDKLYKVNYGKEGINYKICLIDSHYFIYDEKTEYTSYYIDNYKDIKHIENAKYIYKKDVKGYYQKDKLRTLNSFNLINRLLENKEVFFKEININNVNIYDEPQANYNLNVNSYNDLTYNRDYSIRETNLKNISLRNLEKIKNDNDDDNDDDNEDKKEEQKYINVFFDCETYEYKQENLKDIKKPLRVHKAYLIAFKIDLEGENIKSFYGNDCIKRFLDYLNNYDNENIKEYESKTHRINYKLIAHNAKYDMRFLIKHLSKCEELTNGTSFITFKGEYGYINNVKGQERKNIKIIIKDSYKLIPVPLRDFADMFFENKEVIKEIMPYSFYNIDTLTNRFNPLEQILKSIEFKTEKDKEQFLKNCNNWGCIDKDNKVDIIIYSLRYCEIDVDILNKGYNIFRNWCINDLNLNIDDILTLPSMGFKYLKNKGVYNECFSLGGLPREFIQKSVRGGRTMSNNNEMFKFTEKHNKIFNDFDAVSLYPSAMARIEGFIKGEPKILNDNQLEYNIIKKFNFYFVEIEILKVGILRKFPLMSIMNEKTKSREYTNNTIGHKIIVNKYDLEDLINFQKVEFKILRGYFFNDGFNTKINEEIKYLFEKRKELKKIGNKSQSLYKLIMNASYGKLIQKPHDKKIKFFDKKDDYNKFYERYYNEMITATNYDENDENKMRVEIKTHTGEFFTEPHLGSMILSMSKRIMNELICLGEDLNLNIYYQDTDSIHIEDKEIEILKNAYELKYNKNLIGEEMGEFHSDFNDKFNINEEIIKVKNVVSIALIVLGKKAYIDKLRGTDKNGNIHYNYHIRLKGVSSEAIEHFKTSKNYKNEFDIYNDLYNGKALKFDLTAGGKKPCFEFNKYYNVNSKDEFKREVKFKKDLKVN